jgi:hypothetical protein
MERRDGSGPHRSLDHVVIVASRGPPAAIPHVVSTTLHVLDAFLAVH